jgi:murein DD-endopeptidase MepM/ murein hydrolase activator NlpD
VFPERQLLLRSSSNVRSILFPGWMQAMVVVACVGTLVSAGFLAAQYVALHRTLDQIAGTDNSSLLSLHTDTPDAARAIANGTAMVDLNHRLAALNDQYTALNGQYATLKSQHDSDQDKITALAAQVTALNDAAAKANSGQAAADLTATLNDARTALQNSEAQRTDQANRLRQLESDMQAAKQRNDQMKTQMAAKDQQLQQVMLERDRFRALLNDKSSKAAPVLVPPAVNPQSSAVVTPPVDDEQTDSLVDNPSAPPPPSPADNRGAGQIRGDNSAGRVAGEMEMLLASTGLDVERLLSRIGPVASNAPAQGGPFVALNSPTAVAAEDSQRQAQLQKLLKTLPLTAPLVNYQIGSGFGPRRDPFNGREAYHTGLDLEAPYRTPVYSTAPGTVIFTGVKEGYGRTVDISHGNGIVTRFAHLHRILVARGQRVGAHYELGELGSTGRSTGPHLHYEVIVDGRPLDPAKFLEAGRNVVQARSQQ